MLGQLRELGMPPVEIEAARKEAEAKWRMEAGDFRVHPANVTAVRLFLAMATQWRQVGLGTMGKAQAIKTGLDYGALKITARLAGLGKIKPADFRRLQTLETEALTAWAIQRAKK